MTAIRILAIGALAGCANTTGGDLIDIPFESGGVLRDATQPFAFTNPLGWQVTLDQALIALGPFYFNVDPPSTDEFRSGLVIIQATEQTIVDALDPTLQVVTGGANGETGSAVAVEIGLLAPDVYSQAADPTDSATLGAAFGYVVGTATMPGSGSGSATTIGFQGSVAVDSSLVTPTMPLAALQRIQGASVNVEFVATPQTLVLRVDPTHWFDQSDFSQLAATGGTWTIDTTFASQLLEGVDSEENVYLFSLVDTRSGGSNE
jgi:hypothetical protein